MNHIIKNNKKGEFGNMMFVMLAIIAVATILILAFWLNTMYTKIKDSNNIKNCQASIAAHAFIAAGSKGEIYTDVKCPTRTVRLDPGDSKVNEKIAEDMHRCWYEWGKGKLRLFEGEGIFCHICSVYQFEEYDKKVYGLMQYIATQNIQVKYPGDIKGLSYMDYFQGYESPKSKEYIDNSDQQKIKQMYEGDYLDTNQKYATFFVYASGKDGITSFLDGGGRSTLTAGGGILMSLGITASLAGATGIIATFTTALTAGTLNAWNPVGWVILAGVGVGGVILGGAALYTAIFGGDDPEWMSTIVFKDYNNDSISALGCQYIETNQLTATVK
jgi:hypothetical protein